MRPGAASVIGYPCADRRAGAAPQFLSRSNLISNDSFAEAARGRTGRPPPQRGRADRQGHGRRRRADRGAVDDQYRHRGSGQHREADRRAGPRRLRAGAHHGQHAGRGRGGAADRRAPGDDGRGRADHRRLPLQRPSAAGGRAGLRRGAGQVPHQPRQCRLRQEEGRPVRRDHREGDPVRQAGAHRRQLGFAGPGDGRHADGREPRPRRTVGCRPCGARGADPLGAGFGRQGRGDRPAARSHHPVVQGVRRAGADRGVSRPGRAAATTRCTWA